MVDSNPGGWSTPFAASLRQFPEIPGGEGPLLTLETRVDQAPEILCQEIEGEAVLLGLESGEYYQLNEAGSRIWALCDGNRTLREVISTLSLEFDAPTDEIRKDTLELVQDLIDEGLAAQLPGPAQPPGPG